MWHPWELYATDLFIYLLLMVQCVMLYGAETWALGGHQENKLLATEQQQAIQEKRQFEEI